MISGGLCLVMVKVASSIIIYQFNKYQTQLQFQFELSLAQLSPCLFILFIYASQIVYLF